jgi:hypothetical protein
MNRILLALGVLALTFTACDKKKSSILPPPEVDTVYIDTTTVKPVDTSLTIAGISDIRTTPWSEVVLPITVMRNIGSEQKVSMSISGVPAGVKAEFSSVTGYTTFNTNLMLDVRFAKPGTYEMTIKSLSETGKTKDYVLHLVIDTLTNREINNLFFSKVLNNAMPTTDSTDSTVYQQTYLMNNALENQLYLRNIVLNIGTTFSESFISYMTGANANYHVKVMVNMAEGTVIIPDQIIEGRSMQGANYRDFTVAGQGKIDIDNGTYSITYITIHDDNGSFVIRNYTVKGALRD